MKTGLIKGILLLILFTTPLVQADEIESNHLRLSEERVAIDKEEARLEETKLMAPLFSSKDEEKLKLSQSNQDKQLDQYQGQLFSGIKLTDKKDQGKALFTQEVTSRPLDPSAKEKAFSLFSPALLYLYLSLFLLGLASYGTYYYLKKENLIDEELSESDYQL